TRLPADGEAGLLGAPGVHAPLDRLEVCAEADQHRPPARDVDRSRQPECRDLELDRLEADGGPSVAMRAPEPEPEPRAEAPAGPDRDRVARFARDIGLRVELVEAPREVVVRRAGVLAKTDGDRGDPPVRVGPDPIVGTVTRVRDARRGRLVGPLALLVHGFLVRRLHPRVVEAREEPDGEPRSCDHEHDAREPPPQQSRHDQSSSGSSRSSVARYRTTSLPARLGSESTIASTSAVWSWSSCPAPARFVRMFSMIASRRFS